MREENTNRTRIGIDLGGTKIELIALDADGSELLRFRQRTPAGDYLQTIKTVVDMVRGAESRLCMNRENSTVGIGTPGATSFKSGLMKNCNSTCLNGQSLQQDLELALARPVRMSNDANCFALSEAVDGAGKAYDVLFGVIIGTGVGGGLVVHGSVLDGANHIAGEWGHNPLLYPETCELPGPDCYCGRAGCIETWLSGPGMAADHLRVSGCNITAEQIVKQAEAGDLDCSQTIDRYCDRLARSLAGVVNILDPDVIVLGGGLSNIAQLYEQVPEIWQQYIFSDEVRTQLLPPAFGDSSGVRGAAWLWGR
ncbi:fructokinase [Mariprofundus micogutta]|uniref:Fructokinase n=1 Tax=Mariprofundus micogutta TaxID=1921010 RepID=A0A1L8CME3_9PROT|nr:ROK family protein [Mariprofundus micogutta]GAV20076.1 fructokinase [Mariprofundus micogutta]